MLAYYHKNQWWLINVVDARECHKAAMSDLCAGDLQNKNSWILLSFINTEMMHSCWIPSLWKIKILLSCTVNTEVVDDLVM